MTTERFLIHERSAKRLPEASRDRGFTFIEIVVAVALMAVIIVPVFAAVTLAVKESARARSAAQVETAILNAADRVNRAPKRCTYRPYVEAAIRSQQWDASQVLDVIEERYVPPANLNHAGPADWVLGACQDMASAPPDLLVQRVTITIASPDGRVTRTIQVVKSDV